MQRLQQPQDAACVSEAGADRRVQVLDSRQSFQTGRIGDFQHLAEGFQGRTDRLHHQLVFVPVLGAVQQGLSEPGIFLGIAAAGDGPGQGMGECLAGANADQAFRGGAEEAGVAAATGEQLGVGMLQTQVFDDLPRPRCRREAGPGCGPARPCRSVPGGHCLPRRSPWLPIACAPAPKRRPARQRSAPRAGVWPAAPGAVAPSSGRRPGPGHLRRAWPGVGRVPGSVRPRAAR